MGQIQGQALDVAVMDALDQLTQNMVQLHWRLIIEDGCDFDSMKRGFTPAEIANAINEKFGTDAVAASTVGRSLRRLVEYDSDRHGKAMAIDFFVSGSKVWLRMEDVQRLRATRREMSAIATLIEDHEGELSIAEVRLAELVSEVKALGAHGVTTAIWKLEETIRRHKDLEGAEPFPHKPEGAIEDKTPA